MSHVIDVTCDMLSSALSLSHPCLGFACLLASHPIFRVATVCWPNLIFLLFVCLKNYIFHKWLMSALSIATPFQGVKNWSWSLNQMWILWGFRIGGFPKTGFGHRHVPVSELVLITELVLLSELVPIARSFHMQLFCYLQWVVGGVSVLLEDKRRSSDHTQQSAAPMIGVHWSCSFSDHNHDHDDDHDHGHTL